MEKQRRIEEIEARAAESELIGRLATDPEVRIYNLRLAEELRAYVKQLRGAPSPDVPSGNVEADISSDGATANKAKRR